MKNQKPIFLFLFYFIYSIRVLALSGKDELNTGWDLFAKNDFSKAEEHFKNALKDPTVADDANLSLAMLSTGMYKNKQAIEYFNQYIALSANPNPGIFAMESSPFITSQKSQEMQLFYENMLKLPKLDETTRAMAYERLANIYCSNDQVEKGRQTADKIGSIQDWSVLGSFENLSGSGFNKDYGALTHPEPDYSFKNKINAEIKWFTIPKERIRNDRWIDFDYYMNISNAIVYAQTFVTAPSDIECQFRLGTSGSYKVWINDHLIMSDDEERNNDLDTYISTVKLSKGVNRILIQLGASEINSLNFMCRFTDNAGKLIQGLTYSPNYTAYNKSYDYTGKLIPISSEEFFKNRLKENPKLLLNYLCLANCYLRNDKAFDAAHIIRDAEKFAPDCVYLLALKSEQAVRAKNQPGLSATLKKLKEVMPNSYDALQLEYQEASDGENWDKAEEVLEKIKANFGEDESTIQRQISIYGGTKQIEKMISLIEDAYKKYPDNYTFVTLKVLIETKVRKNNSDAERVLKKYIDKHSNTNAMGDLLDQYLETGNASGAVSTLEKMIKIEPFAIGYLSKMSVLQYSLGNYKKGHDYIEMCKQMAPYIGAYDETAGDLYDAEHKSSDAKNSYKRAIQYSPTNYDAREKLRKLEDKPEIFEPFGKPDFQKLYKSAPSAEDYPEDNSVILVDEDQKVIFKGGASVERSFLMVKVFNTAGIDFWKEYNIPQYSAQRLVVDEAYIIKKNGSKVDADRNDNQIAFTTLEVGDAICLSYKIENYYTGKLAQHFSEIHYFNYFFPVMRSAYQVMADSSISLYYKLKNSNIQATTKNVDEFKLYSWVETNKPALKSENSMPEIGDIAPSLRVSTFKEWDDVAKWYSEISSSKAKADYELKELMKELFDGKGPMTKLEKAKYMYDYIVREIRYSSVSFRQSGLIPQSTSNVLNSKMGDCKDISTLFVAMCREVGIEANLTLVNTRDNGDNTMYLPCIDFDHCIAAINIDNKKYYVELTNDNNAFSTMSGDLYYAQALEIRDNSKNDLIHLPNTNAIPNFVSRQTKMTVEGEKITVQKKTTKCGVNAAYMRSSYRDIGKEQQEKNLKESINDEFPSVHLDGFHFDDNLKSTKDTITYEFTYSSKDAINDVGGMRVIRIPFSEGITSLDFLSEETRKFPIVGTGLLFNSESSEVITLSLPAGTTLLKLPEAKVFTSEFGDYSLTFKQNLNSYTITRKFKPKGNGEIPTEKYAEFKSFFEKVIKADAVQLALK